MASTPVKNTKRTSAKTRLQRLKDQREEKVLEAELRQLERQEKLVEADYTTLVNMQDRYFFDGPSGIPEPLPSRADDRKDGDNRPFWSDEQELSRIRGICRFLATSNEIGLGALDTLGNYVVGPGFDYEIESKASPNDADDATHIWDEFDERVEFSGDLDFEIFHRVRRDGEVFVNVKPVGNGRSIIRIIEPDEVTEPGCTWELEEYWNIPPGASWKYGIATDADDTSLVYGYFVCWNGDQRRTEFIPADQMVHVKINVDRRVKRGLSDFYCVWEELIRAEKLLGNTVQGAAIQAAIAYIRKHASTVSSAQIDGVQATLTTPKNVGTDSTAVKVQTDRPGTIIDAKDCDTEFGPMGTPGGANYISVLQAAYRTIGVRWHMPEYMISGDGSNGNYASALVAESPFVKFASVVQKRTGEAFNKIRKMVVRNAANGGLLSTGWIKLRKMLTFTAIGPLVETRNRVSEWSVDEGLYNTGAMSLSTLASRYDLDLDDEQEKGAKPEASESTLASPSFEHAYESIDETIARLRESNCGCGCNHDHDKEHYP